MFLDFKERGREGDREGEKHRLFASRPCPQRDLTLNPAMCRGNQIHDLFCLQRDAPTNGATPARTSF